MWETVLRAWIVRVISIRDSRAWHERVFRSEWRLKAVLQTHLAQERVYRRLTELPRSKYLTARNDPIACLNRHGVCLRNFAAIILIATFGLSCAKPLPECFRKTDKNLAVCVTRTWTRGCGPLPSDLTSFFFLGPFLFFLLFLGALCFFLFFSFAFVLAPFVAHF